MRWFTPFLAILLSACGGGNDLTGHWEGDCFLSSGFDEDVTYLTELEIDSDEKGELAGEAFFDWTGYGEEFVEVELEGERKGKKFEIGFALPDTLGIPMTVDLEGKVDNDEMTGDCVVRVMGFGVGGDLDLDRVD